MKQERFPYYIVGAVGSDTAQTLNEGQLEARNEERAKSEPIQDPLVPSRAQTFVINEFETVDEFTTFEASDEVKLDIINRAVRLKQQVAAKRLVEAPSWAATESEYDMVAAIAAAVERRKLSDEDKALRAIEKLSPDMQQVLINKLLAAQTAPRAVA